MCTLWSRHIGTPVGFEPWKLRGENHDSFSLADASTMGNA
jgi:hypothetical protein